MPIESNGVIVVDESTVLGRKRCAFDVGIVIWWCLQLFTARKHALQRDEHRADVEHGRPLATENRSADVAVAIYVRVLQNVQDKNTVEVSAFVFMRDPLLNKNKESKRMGLQ